MLRYGDPKDVLAEVAQLRRQLRATWALAGLTLVIGVAVGAAPRRAAEGDHLRVRSLVVVDDAGVERVMIAAPLPDPLMLGRRVDRGGAAHGILVFDEEGNERGGYVTTDGYPNVLLTVDNLDRQAGMLLAEPSGGATLQLVDRDRSVATLSASDGPKLSLERGGKTLAELPAAKEDGR